MEYRNIFRIILLLVLALGASAQSDAAAGGLQNNFYKNSCPQAEQIAQSIVLDRSANDPTMPAKLLRLFFHDCFVRGCDASILIDSSNGTAEKNAVTNLSLGGYAVIDAVKAALEKACPDTVSCADIIAMAAKYSVSLQSQGSLWEVQTGRRDGTISIDQEVVANIPLPGSDFATLVQNFASKGLSSDDLVVLSGAHTIGVGHCNRITDRLYNFTGKGDADPSLNVTYAALLRVQCKNSPDDTAVVAMDPSSGLSFDSHYYTTLKQNKGFFQSDAALITNQTSSKLVEHLQDPTNFLNAFKISITRLGAVGVLTGTDGEIRKNCRAPN